MPTIRFNKMERKVDLYVPFIPESLSGKLLILSLLAMFLMVTSYKLTHASLWLDEAVEYLVSIAPFSKMIPFITTTNQPPLYNFTMHFLLKFSTTEYWFRFTSVLFGFLGCLWLYASVNEASGWKMAGISVFIYSFLRNIVYYNQECSEYTLLICNLFWAAYFYICLLNRFTTKRAIGFTAFCVLSMYSQYGAMFPLTAMSVSLFLFYLFDKKWEVLKELAIMMGTAVATFGAILYFVFIKVQRAHNLEVAAEPFNGLLIELQNFIRMTKADFSFFFPGGYKSFYVFAMAIILWGISQKKINNSGSLQFHQLWPSYCFFWECALAFIHMVFIVPAGTHWRYSLFF